MLGSFICTDPTASCIGSARQSMTKVRRLPALARPARHRSVRHEGERRPHPQRRPQTLAYALLASMQGGMLLTQTLRDAAPLEAAFDSGLERVAAFAADPEAARRMLRLTSRRSRRTRKA
jgi:hypothetical protein